MEDDGLKQKLSFSLTVFPKVRPRKNYLAAPLDFSSFNFLKSADTLRHYLLLLSYQHQVILTLITHLTLVTFLLHFPRAITKKGLGFRIRESFLLWDCKYSFHTRNELQHGS